MRKLLLAVSILFVLCLIAIPLMAQVDPGPTPVVTPMPTDSPFHITFPPSAGEYLKWGLLVMVFVSGLKNTPGTADLFVKWPKLAVIVNALMAFIVKLTFCMGDKTGVEGFSFLNCVIGAIGIFIAAAGWHFIKFSVSPKEVRSTDGVARTAMSPAVSRKTRESIGVTPVIPRR